MSTALDPGLPPTPMELDKVGSTMWSRWTSAKTGRMLVVVNREIWADPPAYVVQVLDVDQEQVTDVNAADWYRWIKTQRIYRKKH